jgi:hypothetical protein
MTTVLTRPRDASYEAVFMAVLRDVEAVIETPGFRMLVMLDLVKTIFDVIKCDNTFTIQKVQFRLPSECVTKIQMIRTYYTHVQTTAHERNIIDDTARRHCTSIRFGPIDRLAPI